MGITVYLSRSPNHSQKGGEYDGMSTITSANELNKKKNRQIRARVMTKLLKHRKKLIQMQNKKKETRKTRTKK